MPITKTKFWGNNHQLAVWLIKESIDELQAMLGAAHVCPPEITHEAKRAEWLAARVCIKYLCENMGISFNGVDKDENGKPLLINQANSELSISHSYPYVAAIISTRHTVGIDIEQVRDKLLKLAPRFLSEEELTQTNNEAERICLYWSAKETLFKYYSKGNVTFKKQLLIAPFDFAEQGIMHGEIRMPDVNKIVELEYEVKDGYVLCYTTPCPTSL